MQAVPDTEMFERLEAERRRLKSERKKEAVIKENQDVSFAIPTGLSWAPAPQSLLIEGKGLFEEEVKTISTLLRKSCVQRNEEGWLLPEEFIGG